MNNNLEDTLNQSYEIEKWKFLNCFDRYEICCQECCSGGTMLGAMCEEMMEKRNNNMKEEVKPIE